MEAVEGILALGGIFIVFSIVLVVGIYALVAYGFYKYLNWLGYANPWFAFIPLANTYALADTCDADGNGNIDILGMFQVPKTLFVWYWALQLLVSFIPAVGGICSLIIGLAGSLKVYSVMFSRLDNKPEKDCVAMAVISYFIPIILTIKCLTGCNSNSNM